MSAGLSRLLVVIVIVIIVYLLLTFRLELCYLPFHIILQNFELFFTVFEFFFICFDMFISLSGIAFSFQDTKILDLKIKIGRTPQ